FPLALMDRLHRIVPALALDRGHLIRHGRPPTIGSPPYPIFPARARGVLSIRSAYTPASERVVDPGEHRDSLAAIADIDIADDERLGDGAHADPAGDMEAVERIVVEIVEDPSGIDEGRQLEAQIGGEEIELEDLAAQLDAGREDVAIDEAVAAEAAQRLPL